MTYVHPPRKHFDEFEIGVLVTFDKTKIRYGHLSDKWFGVITNKIYDRSNDDYWINVLGLYSKSKAFKSTKPFPCALPSEAEYEILICKWDCSIFKKVE